jgi:predicted transcriptional regulator
MKVEMVFRHDVITVVRQAIIAETVFLMRHRHVGDLIVAEPRRQRWTGAIYDFLP